MDFSIVVPTYRRTARLRECLDAIAALDYPRADFEVLVVDDGGADELSPLVEAFHGRVNVRLLVEAHRGPAAARNAGAAAARGRYLAFTDDDCAPARDWLLRLCEASARVPGRMLGGHTVNALDDRPGSRASQLLIDYLYAYFNPDPDDARFLVSCNLAVPRESFHAIGGFDATFPGAAAEDRDLCDRWRQQGLRMVWVPAAVVHHRHALTLAAFWRQHAGYGRGAFRFHRARVARRQGSVRPEPLRFYCRLLLFPFVARTRCPLRMSALLVLSQVANVAGFLAEAVASRFSRGWDEARLEIERRG